MKAQDVMKGEWRQYFETTALAIDGNQKGTFYGSVSWGWKKNIADSQPTLYEFKTKSKDVPSDTFIEAAKLWNISKTINDEEAIDLPVEVSVISDGGVLWDTPDRGKQIAILAKGTPLARIAKVDRKDRIWFVNVKVTGGRDRGKTGWIQAVHLSDE